ncbi:MAG: hypothetical protein PHN72_04920 [Bacilli bacterium]|nr:hypothetical protein [Bacilli bacterium]
MQYYFFGLGNRTKLLFKEGKLINLEDNTVLKEWDTENYLVIPNLYSVILQTKDGKMIKIVEEETGIYVTENDKKTRLEGTETKLHLENFTKQKYAQVKKVLYSEILINIKNGEPLPNFLVYDSVWYRDAAMAAMVLKQTNNINLIQPFVDDVKEMYDKQNNGVEEADNLGELLYIVSASKKDKTTLVENIKKEASTLIHENKKGSYLNGSTDGGEHPLYQSLWYDLGMKAQKEKTTIKIKNVEDTYGSLAWWHKDVKKQWYGTNESADFPYLAYAQYHTIQMGKLTATSTLYPLSYESNGTEADYESLRVLNNSYVENKTSPTHLWTASEMLLFLLDETGNLKAL